MTKRKADNNRSKKKKSQVNIFPQFSQLPNSPSPKIHIPDINSTITTICLSMQGIQLHILTQKTPKPTDTNQSENENPIRQYEFEIEKSNKKNYLPWRVKFW